jgi:hypothetical protein
LAASLSLFGRPPIHFASGVPQDFAENTGFSGFFKKKACDIFVFAAKSPQLDCGFGIWDLGFGISDLGSIR